MTGGAPISDDSFPATASALRELIRGVVREELERAERLRDRITITGSRATLGPDMPGYIEMVRAIEAHAAMSPEFAAAVCDAMATPKPEGPADDA